MRITNRVFTALAAALIFVPATVSGQTSSLNTFSPYSFYGLGDLFTQGTAPMRSMGGAGVAVRDYVSINYLNPASYSAIPLKSAMFTVGLEGQNYYLRDAETKSSFNSFNIRDIALQLPLGSGFGMAFSVTPYSSVGYRVSSSNTDGPEVTEIGYVTRYYSGSGGLTQFKLGLGWELWKGRMSVGAEVAYFHGNIERTYGVAVEPIVSTGTYLSLTGSNTEKINTILVNAGLQLNIIRTSQKVFAFGATYNMGGRVRGNVSDYILHDPTAGIPSAGDLNLIDILRDQSYGSKIYMPHIITAGLHYAKTKYAVALDYTFSTWGSSNSGYEGTNVKFRNTNTIAGGVEWTPDPMSARNYLKRCTYRVGMRYSDYYMSFERDGKWRNIDDKTVTLGIGFPLDPRGRNSIDVGIEAGMKGTAKYGMIKENYFKFSIGFRLFGDDYWFQKYKYN